MNAIEPIGFQTRIMFEPVMPTTHANSFVDLMTSAISRTNDTVNTADKLLRSYAAGDEIATHELMTSMEQAKLSLQMAVEVRNKVVDAYQEFMRMQI